MTSKIHCIDWWLVWRRVVGGRLLFLLIHSVESCIVLFSTIIIIYLLYGLFAHFTWIYASLVASILFIRKNIISEFMNTEHQKRAPNKHITAFWNNYAALNRIFPICCLRALFFLFLCLVCVASDNMLFALLTVSRAPILWQQHCV